MMRSIRNHIIGTANIEGKNRACVRLGVVESYSPSEYMARVSLQPDKVLTGWLPIVSPWIGNGWGVFAPPSIGDLVEVQFQEGGIEAGFICGRFYNDSDRPVSTPSGEFYVVHKSGSYIKLTNDGKVTIRDKSGSTVVMNADGTGTMSFSNSLTINANTKVNGTLETTGKITGGSDIQASGNISDQGGSKTMSGMRNTYNTHHHDNSSTPDVSM